MLSTRCWCARAGWAAAILTLRLSFPKKNLGDIHRLQAPSQSDEVQPREVFGWAMYDFANSGDATAVIAAVFNA